MRLCLQAIPSSDAMQKTLFWVNFSGTCLLHIAMAETQQGTPCHICKQKFRCSTVFCPCQRQVHSRTDGAHGKGITDQSHSA